MAAHTDTTLNKTLDYWKKKLIDLTKRNRLINFKQTKTSTIQLTQPSLHDIYTKLVKRQRTLSFYMPEEEEADTADEDSHAEEAAETPELKQDQVLGEVTGSKLSRVLKNLRLRSRTALQETGTNVLFAAFGLLEWTESADSDTPLYSPLILVPVTVSRESVFDPYTLQLFDDDIVVNPALIQKLQTDFGIELPEFHEMDDAENLESLISQIRNILSKKPDWVIHEEVYVSFFSFSKLAMYKDLEEYESLFLDHSIVQALAGDNSSLPEPREEVPRPEELDEKVHPTEMYQVLDADSSQQEAIIAAKKGASFVLQGPPGTGKSQTIANIIAEALAEDQTVLFVSEKMAALDVVKERLDQKGLGEFCLEAHSEKANKQSIIQELHRTYESPPASADDVDTDELNRLDEIRQELNQYVQALNEKWSALNKTPYQIHGKLTELADAPEIAFDIPNVLEIDQRQFDEVLALINRLTALSHIYEDPSDHPWHGFQIDNTGFQLRSQIDDQFRALISLLSDVEAVGQEMAQEMGVRAPATLEELQRLHKALKVHTPDVFALNLGELNQRIRQQYGSRFKILRYQYWKDMHTIRKTVRDPDSFGIDKARNSLLAAYQVRSRLGKPSNPYVHHSERFNSAHTRLRELMKKIHDALDFLNQLYPLKSKPIGDENPMRLPFQEVRDWLEEKLSHLDELQEWVEYREAVSQLQDAGFGQFLEKASDRGVVAEDLATAFQKQLYRLWLDSVYEQSEVLRNFNSQDYTQLMKQFRTLDQKQMSLAQKRIRHKLTQKRPQFILGDAPSSEQSILRKEAHKKRKHKPIRQLFREIPDLLTTLKPCLMMSPLSVSHFLDPQVKQFDLVVFDEASQVLPEDAIGAISRGRQAIVVGDDQQLPPTQFFANVESDEFTDEEIAEHSAFDSILEECSAAGLTEKMLRWHYRSEDESLIAFSNYHFYDNSLNTFPRARLDGDAIGVSFVHVPDGIYDRGKSRQNRKEAEKVADLVFDHFGINPELSLGVVAFSEAQQMAILDELEKRRRENPQMEPFFDESANEAFFVKNLENVQGDERDVMFFSVGYGYDAAGKLSHNFGPLTAEGGHRRLNVAVTRARHHIKLIASIESSDIDLTRTNSYGARLLRNYLEYAQREGDINVLQGETSPGPTEDFDSPFEREVFHVLQEAGYVVHNQVGCSEYRIDLAVVDPEQPGNYLLGIECDGATYHSSKTARDRDRLRQQVLEHKFDWRIHRIWSRDWAENPQKELDKLTSVIEQVKDSPPAASVNSDAGEADSSENEFSLEADETPDTQSAQVDPATNQLPPGVEVYDPIDPDTISFPGDPESEGAVRHAVDEIVQQEGPIHYKEAARRVAEFQGVARTGARIQRITYHAAIDLGHPISHDFIWPQGMETPPVRVPDEGDAARDIELIPIAEIVEAAQLCLANAFSLTKEDLVKMTSQLLGYERTGDKVKERIQQAIDKLLKDERITFDGDQLKVSS